MFLPPESAGSEQRARAELVLAALAKGESLPILIVAAHPDDETIGAGGHLRLWQPSAVIHVTDGIPRHLPVPKHPRLPTWSDPVQIRRRELEAAMALAGIEKDRLFSIGLFEQELSNDLIGLTRVLREAFRSFESRAIITHAYEGGHPDHDAIAFAAQYACLSLGARAPVRLEMTSAHQRHGRIGSGRFIAGPPLPRRRLRLDRGQQRIKREMLECYRSERAWLENFPGGRSRESFRMAPIYDFCSPPHPGLLLYEMFHWATGGLNGQRWRQLVAAAEAQLRPLLPIPSSLHSP